MALSRSEQSIHTLCEPSQGVESRVAPWLQSEYSESLWIVSDSRDRSKTAKINFRIVMPSGDMLVNHPKLYRTVKEYAWWIRDPRYSGIEDAHTHAILIRNLGWLAHALRLRGLDSFSQVQPFDVEELVECCRYGLDTVVQGFDRVERRVNTILRSNDIASARDAIPVWAKGKQKSNVIRTGEFLETIGVPSKLSQSERVVTLMANLADHLGMNVKRGRACATISPPANLTVQAVHRWIVPLEQLYFMRRHIGSECMTFAPFPSGSMAVAVVKGVGTVRTPIAPPKLALHLMAYAAAVVTDIASRPADSKQERADPIMVAVACWILIAAFSARRCEEVDGLLSDCLRGNITDGWWLKAYTEKTLRRDEWIPIPHLVAMAVQVLLEISKTAREATGCEEIFQRQLLNGSVARFSPNLYLDAFAAEGGVPQTKDEDGLLKNWHWHAHQFRRFFAVLYFYRFESAHLEALSHHLRHFSLDMTRRYVTQDPEVAAVWLDVEWGYMGHVARSIAAGERSISGAMGERLKRSARRIADQLRRKLQIASPERVGASLTLVMKRQGLVLTPQPWVTCSAPKTVDAALKAACRRGQPSDTVAVGPDFSSAGPLVCRSCPFAIVEPEKAGFASAELRHLEAVAATRSRIGTIFGELEAARVVSLRELTDPYEKKQNEPLQSGLVTL